MLNCSASLAMSTSILKALPGKLDMKRHSPSIPYIIFYLEVERVFIFNFNDFLTFCFSDLPETISKSELESLFRINDIVSKAKHTTHQLEISACTGKGLNEVIRWLEQNTK